MREDNLAAIHTNIRVRVWYFSCAYLLKVFYKFVQDFGNVELREV